MLLARPAWISVDLGAIDRNLRRLRRALAPGTELLAVVKAHAYGHGAVPVAKTALAAGARLLGVTCLDEALELRDAGVTADILLLGYAPAWQATTIIAQDVIVTAYDPELLEPLSMAARVLNRPARIHLKVDTGMRRFGPSVAGLRELAERALALPMVQVEGIFSHLATADCPDDRMAREQFAQFREALQVMAGFGCRPRWRHLANSAATLRFPESHYDLVRPGAALYGLDPSPAAPLPAGFERALTFHCLVAQVKEIPVGASVSYGAAWRAQRPTRLAILQAGYADGLRRSPVSWGDVLMHGRRVPLVGAICMDLCMVDVTDVPRVREGDTAVLLGRQGDEEITPWEVAERMGTIGYEVLCSLASRVPRVYLPSDVVRPDHDAVPVSGVPLRRGAEIA